MAENLLKAQRYKSKEVRESVLKFHAEIYQRGFVALLKSLPQAIQDEINMSDFRYFFCWRSIFKAGSLSTPARLVVDPTVSSFNDILAKGINCLTSLYTIVLEWRSNLHCFCREISKMFNSLKLEPEMYKYSLYLFSETLSPGEPTETWVNLTLMYCLVCAANQCTRALRMLAEAKKEDFPLSHKVITHTTYMDDSSGGTNNQKEFNKLVQEMQDLLPIGGFALKILTKCGVPPADKASADDVSEHIC